MISIAGQDPSRAPEGVVSVELLPSALPSTCQPGRFTIGNVVCPDAILIETEHLPDGTKIDRSYTVDQLRDLLTPFVPAGYLDGDPILNVTWEALTVAYPDDEPLTRFCDGMIRAGTGEAWAPLVIGAPIDVQPGGDPSVSSVLSEYPTAP